jgi:hypothetical protein
MVPVAVACSAPFLYFAPTLLAGLLHVVSPPPGAYVIVTFNQWFSVSSGLLVYLVPAGIAVICTIFVFRFFRAQNAL